MLPPSGAGAIVRLRSACRQAGDIMPMCLCRILIGLLVACCWAATPLAQTAEFGAAQKRYRDLTAAGDYAGALDEAQKTAAAVKVSVGEQHEQYAAALLS